MTSLVWLVVACLDGPLVEAERARDRMELDRAASLYDAVLADNPKDARALAGRGWVAQLQGDTNAAGESFQACAQADPREPECLRGLASVAMRVGAGDRAEELLVEAAELAPDDLHVRASRAAWELMNDRTDLAVAIYEDLVASDPYELGYVVGLAEALLRAERYAEAAELAQTHDLRALTSPRDRAMLWHVEARALVWQIEREARDGHGCTATVQAMRTRALRLTRRLIALDVPPPESHRVWRMAMAADTRASEACSGSR